MKKFWFVFVFFRKTNKKICKYPKKRKEIEKRWLSDDAKKNPDKVNRIPKTRKEKINVLINESFLRFSWKYLIQQTKKC